MGTIGHNGVMSNATYYEILLQKKYSKHCNSPLKKTVE